MGKNSKNRKGNNRTPKQPALKSRVVDWVLGGAAVTIIGSMVGCVEDFSSVWARLENRQRYSEGSISGSHIEKSKPLTIFAGSIVTSGSYSDLTDGVMLEDLLKFKVGGGAKAFQAFLKNGKLLIDAEIVVEKGKTVHIQEGKWKNPLKGYDMNWNFHGLEIVDDQLNPIFQIYFPGTNNIILNGRFQFRSGEVYWITQDGFTSDFPKASPWKWFKYPSSLYLNELAVSEETILAPVRAFERTR